MIELHANIANKAFVGATTKPVSLEDSPHCTKPVSVPTASDRPWQDDVSSSSSLHSS